VQVSAVPVGVLVVFQGSSEVFGATSSRLGSTLTEQCST